jgi:hypothetical protein
MELGRNLRCRPSLDCAWGLAWYSYLPVPIPSRCRRQLNTARHDAVPLEVGVYYSPEFRLF